jgi:hypothetical protein
MLSDLRRYYRINLLDVFDGESGLTAHVVLWLVEHLPEDSATMAAVRGGPQFRAWTSQMYMLAAQVNMLYAANRQRAGKATRSGIVKPPVAKKAEPKRVLDLKAVQAKLKSRELHELAAKHRANQL